MEVDDEDGGDDSDMEETTLPSIDDVLDTETWRRKQRLHKQQSNVRKWIKQNFLSINSHCGCVFFCWLGRLLDDLTLRQYFVVHSQASQSLRAQVIHYHVQKWTHIA